MMGVIILTSSSIFAALLASANSHVSATACLEWLLSNARLIFEKAVSVGLRRMAKVVGDGTATLVFWMVKSIEVYTRLYAIRKGIGKDSNQIETIEVRVAEQVESEFWR